ncbi:MAG TPA: transketolase [Ruminiclostridium sp.]|nr:transketolase [Ruminiclostridium sp.]
MAFTNTAQALGIDSEMKSPTDFHDYSYINHKNNYEILKSIANTIRKDCLRMIWNAGSGHPSASFSMADIITVLYFSVMNVDPNNPKWIDRDRFILSKGHGCPALYAALARRGFYDCKELSTLRSINSRLQGHPDMNKTPGVEMSTGSLGIGFSAAVGMAIRGAMKKNPYFVYALIGDGEMDEGLIWEAAMAASHFKLDNLIGIIDRNYGQVDGKTEDVMSSEPIADKWKSFGWYVLEVDGHSIPNLLHAFALAKEIPNRPKMLICHTVKGKGVSFLEGKQELYGENMTEQQFNTAMEELTGIVQSGNLEE